MPPTTNQDLERKIDILTVRLDNFAANVQDRFDTVEVKVDKLSEAIYGNGEPGLKEQVRSVVKVVDEFRVDGTPKLRSISDKIDGRIERLESIHAACPIADLKTEVEKIKSAGKSASGQSRGSAYVTWQWILEKTILPVLITFVAWFLFTILPELVRGIPHP